MQQSKYLFTKCFAHKPWHGNCSRMAIKSSATFGLMVVIDLKSSIALENCWYESGHLFASTSCVRSMQFVFISIQYKKLMLFEAYTFFRECKRVNEWCLCRCGVNSIQIILKFSFLEMVICPSTKTFWIQTKQCTLPKNFQFRPMLRSDTPMRNTDWRSHCIVLVSRMLT